MRGNMILYRGSLKSCNYRCSYCPFSKRRMSDRELEEDQKQWRRFCRQLLHRAACMEIQALMVVPYGEALIHPWYWEGMAVLSASDKIEAVGAQTNLSFSVPDALDRFLRLGGRMEKLRFWATYHPEMVSVDEFARKCAALTEAGASLCAGAVGVPEHRELIKKLRQALPPSVYLWINKMDGLKRPYTEAEKAAFQEIDPFFLRELTPVSGDRRQCQGRLFVEGNGTMRTCNISQPQKVSWYELEDMLPEPECSRKRCSCYLAYGGRRDCFNQVLFGPYPLFRIPRRPKAVFLDIDGTLIPPGASAVPARIKDLLAMLVKGEGSLLFFATSRPYEEAMARCSEIRHLFRGGIFAGGSHICFEESCAASEKPVSKRELVYPLEDGCLAYLKPFQGPFHFRILVYRRKKTLYKLTLIRPGHMPWRKLEAEELFHHLPEAMQGTLRYFIEEHCLQIVSARADKANGVRTVCRWLKISPSETAAAGDSDEDKEMLALCNGEKW